MAFLILSYSLDVRYVPLHILCFKFMFSYLKGQSHEKVGEMRVQGDSLGPNLEQLLVFKLF
jgi:hypothetical protein